MSPATQALRPDAGSPPDCSGDEERSLPTDPPTAGRCRVPSATAADAA